MDKLEGHKARPISWFCVYCECGWTSAKYRNDSEGIKDAWAEYHYHEEQEKTKVIRKELEHE